MKKQFFVALAFTAVSVAHASGSHLNAVLLERRDSINQHGITVSDYRKIYAESSSTLRGTDTQDEQGYAFYCNLIKTPNGTKLRLTALETSTQAVLKTLETTPSESEAAISLESGRLIYNCTLN